jgi:DNA-binding NtrC family response regulator
MIKKKNIIFVLEDSTYQRDQIIETLKQADRKIIYAGTIRKAQNLYDRNASEIDLFILDLKLPDGNGMDFLQRVRKSLHNTPVIITSATITDTIREQAKGLQVNTFFEKPIIMDNLEQAVSNVLHV